MTGELLISPDMDEQLAQEIHRVPEHCRSGLLNYIRYGVPAGGFLTAVLSNDLKTAAAHADEANQRALYDYIFVLYNCAPTGAWGSPEKVQAWLQRGAESRQQPVIDGGKDL